MKKFLPLVIMLLVITSCAIQPSADGEDQNNTARGALIGAIAGAVIGGQLDDDGNRDRGIIAGAAAGAIAGAAIGRQMDKQEDEFRAALEEEQRRSEIEIERVTDELLRLTFDSGVTFDYDSALIKPNFTPSLSKVSDVIAKYGSEAEIVGHTDSTGSEAYNQQLSERRALSVKVYLLEQGVGVDQLSSYGLGESRPIDTNETEAGRQINRRVEILVRPNPSAGS